MRLKYNLHIHTYHSPCATKRMKVEDIISKAEEVGFEIIGLSDHLDPLQVSLDFVYSNRERLKEINPSMRVLVGCEMSMLSPKRATLNKSKAHLFDYIIAACNHYHLDWVERPKDETPSGYARHYLKMLEGAIDLGFVKIIAHPFYLNALGDFNQNEVISYYEQDELIRILKKAAQANIALELNPRTKFFPGLVKEVIPLCRLCGVRFVPGSDAHDLGEIAYGKNSESSLESLGITADDLIKVENLWTK